MTLQAHLGAASPAEHAALYRQAVALIEQLQRRGAELASDATRRTAVAFDVEKLTWELEFFASYFLEGYRGVRARRRRAGGALRGVAGDRRRSSPPSRACSAIATITAAT